MLTVPLFQRLPQVQNCELQFRKMTFNLLARAFNLIASYIDDFLFGNRRRIKNTSIVLSVSRTSIRLWPPCVKAAGSSGVTPSSGAEPVGGLKLFVLNNLGLRLKVKGCRCAAVP